MLSPPCSACVCGFDAYQHLRICLFVLNTWCLPSRFNYLYTSWICEVSCFLAVLLWIHHLHTLTVVINSLKSTWSLPLKLVQLIDDYGVDADIREALITESIKNHIS